MKWFLGPALLFLLIAGIVKCQENAVKNIPPSLIECYENEALRSWNQLPHSIDTLIALIRKIESHSHLNPEVLKMSYLSTALLHRYRQDGIMFNPNVQPRRGVIPYAPLGKQFYRFAQMLRVIPGNAYNFPNQSLTSLEWCTLHSMLTDSVDVFEGGDKSRVCKYANYFHRYSRSVDKDVETLSPEQLDLMSKTEAREDPNSQYPEWPPNHPSNSARLVSSIPPSKCPRETGVISTPWGTVSAGALIAGIAAGLEPQQIRIDELIKQQGEPRVSGYNNDITLDNKFLATLAGDLAEVALKQGPEKQNSRYILGVEGDWNSTSWPIFYFLGSNENLQMTGPNIRGDLDGLILGTRVPEYYSQARDFRLSQALELYYSELGLIERNVRACNRRDHLHLVAPSDLLTAQTLSAAILLSPDIAPATFTVEAVENFVKQAVENLNSQIATMNKDENCNNLSGGLAKVISEPAVDLTIILDASWPYETIQRILLYVLQNIQINPLNSNFTIINGKDGAFLINSTNSILEFYHLNSTVYNRLVRGFEFTRVLDLLWQLETEKMNREQSKGWGGGKSEVVLFMPYQNSLSREERDLYEERMRRMNEEMPDVNVFFLTYGAKDQWSNLVPNPDTDIASVSSFGDSSPEFISGVGQLVSRIKQVPRRLINSQCGANYEPIGQSRPISESVPPGGINYYRMHANYFFGASEPKIKIQNNGPTSLQVCASRELLHINATEATAKATCTIVMQGRNHPITLDCDGANYISECKPFYLSISANATAKPSLSCRDSRTCKYPHSVPYTILYENLVCTSSSVTLIVSPLMLVLIITRFIF